MRSVSVLQYSDVVLVVLSVAPALALGAPRIGYALGAGGWALQRLIGALDKHWVGKLSDPMKRLGANLFESFGRIWLLAGVIVLAAVLGGRPDGLAAAVIIFVAYSIAFVIKVFMGPQR